MYFVQCKDYLLRRCWSYTNAGLFIFYFIVKFIKIMTMPMVSVVAMTMCIPGMLKTLQVSVVQMEVVAM